MSSSHDSHGVRGGFTVWLENWWPALVIGYGACLAAILASSAAGVR